MLFLTNLYRQTCDRLLIACVRLDKWRNGCIVVLYIHGWASSSAPDCTLWDMHIGICIIAASHLRHARSERRVEEPRGYLRPERRCWAVDRQKSRKGVISCVFSRLLTLRLGRRLAMSCQYVRTYVRCGTCIRTGRNARRDKTAGGQPPITRLV